MITSDQWLLSDTRPSGGFTSATMAISSPTISVYVTQNNQLSFTVRLNRQDDAYSHYADNKNGYGVGLALDGIANQAGADLREVIAALDFSAADGSDIRSALPLLSGEAYASATGVLVNASGATRSAANNRLQQAFGGTSTTAVSVMNYAPVAQTGAAAGAINTVTPEVKF